MRDLKRLDNKSTLGNRIDNTGTKDRNPASASIALMRRDLAPQFFFFAGREVRNIIPRRLYAPFAHAAVFC